LNKHRTRAILTGVIALTMAFTYFFSIAIPISSLAKGQDRQSVRTLAGGGAWLLRNITAAGTAVQGRSQVMDNNGIPHVTYVTTDQVLHYSTWNGSAWTDEPISTDYAVLPPAQIALDPTGGLHIIFMTVGPSAPRVYYASHAATWTTELVEMTASNPWLAFDTAGHAHVVFQDTRPIPPAGSGMGLVQYTKGSGSGWAAETIVLRDCSSGCGDVNLVMDKNDNPHVAYMDGGGIRYAYKDAGEWKTEVVSLAGLNLSLAVDQSGNPKVAYTVAGPDVQLATRSGTTWSSSLVDGDMVASPSLVFNQFDAVLLTFNDVRPIPPNGPGFGLRYAFQNGVSWEIQDVDGMTETNGSWLTLDKNGNPSVLYYDSTLQQLKYAQWVPTAASTGVPTSGGSLDSLADQTNYSFPLNTFTDEVTVTHTPVFSGSLPPTLGVISIGHGFEVAAAYTDTGDPAQPAAGQSYSVTIQYTAGQLGLVDESTLALYYWDGSGWVHEPSSQVNITANVVTATPNHFSVWAVLGETNWLSLPLILR
jgi:hypothetical protein